ncbi:MAG: hypothetical protein KJP06_07610 [Deltaproteobacteria bacterium]|nr:hypothetical protein [Deltaproteobacteria bacterium]
MVEIKRKKCGNCNELFIPDPRNVKRQKYCHKSECRKASKAASQRHWLQKPENQDYFCGPDNVKRVQLWREANPGYWRGKQKNTKDALQDPLNPQPIENNTDSVEFAHDALQDFLIAQSPVLLGLIANFTGNALQDNMVITLQRLQKLGQDIVTNLTHSKGDHYGIQGSHRCPTHPQSSQSLQLDRSPPGS